MIIGALEALCRLLGKATKMIYYQISKLVPKLGKATKMIYYQISRLVPKQYVCNASELFTSSDDSDNKIDSLYVHLYLERKFDIVKDDLINFYVISIVPKSFEIKKV